MYIQLSFHPQGNEQLVFVFIWRPSLLPTCEASSQQTSISGVTWNAITTSSFGTNFETSYHILSQSAAFSGVLFHPAKCHCALYMTTPWRENDFLIACSLWAPVPYSSPDSKVHGANMGPIWGRQAQVGPMLAPWTLLSGRFPLRKASNMLMPPLVLPCSHKQVTSCCAKQSVCRWFEKPWCSRDVNVKSILLHGFVMFLHTLSWPARRAHVVLSQNKRTTFFFSHGYNNCTALGWSLLVMALLTKLSREHGQTVHWFLIEFRLILFPIFHYCWKTHVFRNRWHK